MVIDHTERQPGVCLHGDETRKMTRNQNEPRPGGTSEKSGKQERMQPYRIARTRLPGSLIHAQPLGRYLQPVGSYQTRPANRDALSYDGHSIQEQAEPRKS